LGKPIQRLTISRSDYSQTLEASNEKDSEDWQSLLDQEEAFNKSRKKKKKKPKK